MQIYFMSDLKHCETGWQGSAPGSGLDSGVDQPFHQVTRFQVLDSVLW